MRYAPIPFDRVAVLVAPLALFATGCAEEEECAAPRNASQEIVPEQPWLYGHVARDVARHDARQAVAVPPEVVYFNGPPPPDARTEREQQPQSDPQWQVETYYVPPPSSEYYVPPPHPIPRHTISLGYIGDWPLRSGGDPPAAPWWRPFPSSWERSFQGARVYGNPYHYGGP